MSHDSMRKTISRLSFRFGCVYYGFESSRVVERQICQRFAVQADAFLAKLVDEGAVVEAQWTHSGVDTGNPKTAVSALFELTVAEGILPTFLERVLCNGVNFGTGAEVAACG